MRCGARVALGVAGGYFLGRTKKMKLALMLGGMAAGRRNGGPGALLAQGKNLVGSSPELTRLADEVRGRLVEAGKGAALAVATRQVESLTDRMGKRVESSLGNVASGAAGRRSKDRDEEPEAAAPAEDEPAEDEPAEDEPEDDRPAARDEDTEDRATEDEDTEPAGERRRAPSSPRPDNRGGRGTAAAGRRAGTNAASGTRRAAKAAAGRPARARRRDDDG